MPDTLDIDSIDPNFVPPTRPPSALSARSDTSYFALYEESESERVDQKNPPPEYLPRRIVVETIRRHGWECLLCGRKDDLTVVRAVLQHGCDSSDQDPISWLKTFSLIPPLYERDDWTNLMTLCEPHARAHDTDVWRWVPGAKYRAQMPNAVSSRPASVPADSAGDEDGDVTMTDEATIDKLTKELARTSSKVLLGSDEGVLAETLVDDGISGNTKNPEINFKPMELPQFDVLVFRPESMPAVQNAPSASCAMVWADWRKLTLNPFVAYASSLSVIGTDSGSSREEAFQRVLDECLAIRSGWDAVSL